MWVSRSAWGALIHRVAILEHNLKCAAAKDVYVLPEPETRGYPGAWMPLAQVVMKLCELQRLYYRPAVNTPRELVVVAPKENA